MPVFIKRERRENAGEEEKLNSCLWIHCLNSERTEEFKRASDLQEIDPGVDGSLYLGLRLIGQLLPLHCRKGEISYSS